MACPPPSSKDPSHSAAAHNQDPSVATKSLCSSRMLRAKPGGARGSVLLRYGEVSFK